MNMSDIPGKPLVVKINNDPSVRTRDKIYFFENPSGKVIWAKAQEAWNLFSGRRQHIKRPREFFKLIGTSWGDKYAQAIKESHQIFSEKGLEAAQDRLRLGLEEELEVAKLNIEPPPNFDTMGQSGEPVDLNRLRN